MRVYLSGPITGVKNYRERFSEAASRLEREKLDVVNPAELCWVLPASTTWDEIMRIDLQLLDLCDAIVMLPGWRKSLGAQREYGYALAKAKIIWEMEQ